jgi:hypothetical protein
VPFLKFSRDKRGYENYYLFDGKGRARLLFWFRTPPQVKVGRAPFSDDVRRMVEAQNPGVFFDWARIMATPIPSPDVDKWRERRRVEKAAKRAAREAEAEDVEAAEDTGAEPVAAEPAGAEAQAGPQEDVEEAEVAAAVEAETPVATSDVQSAQPGHRRRRRRRRGRRAGGNPPDAPVTDVAQPEAAPLPEPETSSNDEV